MEPVSLLVSLFASPIIAQSDCHRECGHGVIPLRQQDKTVTKARGETIRSDVPKVCKSRRCAMAEYQYIADNAWKAARERLTLLELGADPWTIRNLGLLGVQAGWHCLEVAGGGGSIAAWLCN